MRFNPAGESAGDTPGSFELIATIPTPLPP
jgi:hypothetical protein